MKKYAIAMFWRPRHDRIIHNVTRIQFCPTYCGSFVRKLDPSIFTAFSIYYPPELIYFCVSESAINSFDLSLCYSLKYSPHEHINVIQVCRLDQVVPVNENQGSEFALDLFGPEASTLLLLQINGQFPTEQYLPCLFWFHNQ